MHIEVLDNVFAWLSEHELTYVAMILLLFLAPRVLNRMGIPLAIGAYAVGLALSSHKDYFQNGQVVPTFALLGIVSLFVFAGLEINPPELRAQAKTLSVHILGRTVVVILGAILLAQAF